MTNQPDIVKRLRGMVQIYAGTARPKSWADEAADEIERLREAVRVLAVRITTVASKSRHAVDKALLDFGYDSIRFADVRHGGFSGMAADRDIANPLAAAAIREAEGRIG